MSADILGRPLEETAWGIVDRAVEWRCSKVQLFKPYFNRAMIEKAHSCGLLCNVFWSDDPKEAAEFFDLGADTILTNDYLAIARVKESRMADR